MGAIHDLAVQVTRQAARAVAGNLRAMPPEKQTWSPLDAGRTALSLVQECAVMNRYFAGILRDRKAPEFNWAEYQAACNALETSEKALAELEKATDELVREICAFPEGELATMVRMPWGEGFTVPFQAVMFMPYWNMTYHQGQLAYIQTLYGDREMHGMD